MENTTIFAFGDLLREFRKRRQLSQRSLAARLGVHRNTIGIWERGDFLPESKTIVLEVARQLKLDEQETRFLLEASLTALVPYWSVPLPRNPFFTGRDDLIGTLHQILCTDQVVALTQSCALHGLGGIGKTQIALEYAYRHALEYHAIFWVEAETIESIMASIQRIAEHLQLPERGEADQQRTVRSVQRWLTTHSEWLLIWDNVEDLNFLQLLLPPTRQGAILITTRCQALGTLARGVELLPMAPEEGMLFTLRRAKVLGPEATREQLHQLAQHLPTEWKAVEELVQAMEGLPLALDQAGAYIEETGCRVTDYLQRCYDQRQHVLARRGAYGGAHPASVATTLGLSVERVEQKHPAAADLLRLCAFLHSEAIPEELFAAGASHLGSVLGPVVADPYQFDLVLAALRDASLVTRQPETQTLSVHRLVQAVLQDQMEPADVPLWSERVVCMVNAAFPEPKFNTWARCERYLAQALACVPLIESAGSDLPEAGELLYRAGGYLVERVRYEEAESLLARAVALGERHYGTDHPVLIPRLERQAELFWRKGKYELVEPLLHRVLELGERNLGSEHPQTAETLNHLAALYQTQGKYERAMSMLRRGVRIQEQQLGPEYPAMAEMLNNLGILHSRQGKHEQAEPLFRRALHIQEQQVGPEHPLVASKLHNLAFLYLLQEKYEQAEPLFQRALRIQEQQLGPKHPETAETLNDLATLYRDQGKYQQAEPLYQRALGIREQQVGPEHLVIAETLSNLATLYREQGNYAQAEPLYRRALHIWEQQVGPEHPRTATTLSNLATLYWNLRKDEQAESLFQQALRIQEQCLGPHHPETAQTLNGLAHLYAQQERYEQAEALYKRALRIQEQHPGRCHPDGARSLVGLAGLCEKQGKEEQVEPLLQQAYAIFAQCLGQAHPETVKARNDYYHLLEQRKGTTLLLLDKPQAQGPVPQIISEKPDRATIPSMTVAVRGKTEQIAYTRNVRMRNVTITCALCGQTVTQPHYPSGRIKYCSDACRAIRRAQMDEERVRKQREKRRVERELSQSAPQRQNK